MTEPQWGPFSQKQLKKDGPVSMLGRVCERTSTGPWRGFLTEACRWNCLQIPDLSHVYNNVTSHIMTATSTQDLLLPDVQMTSTNSSESQDYRYLKLNNKHIMISSERFWEACTCIHKVLVKNRCPQHQQSRIRQNLYVLHFDSTPSQGQVMSEKCDCEQRLIRWTYCPSLVTIIQTLNIALYM